MVGLYYSKIQKRDAELLEQRYRQNRIEIVKMIEMPEAEEEAKQRHKDMEKWYPTPEYQKESINDENYKSIRSKLKLIPHPKKENLPKFLQLDLNRKVTFAETCLAFVVYENDICRGELEKEENTQDVASPVNPN